MFSGFEKTFDTIYSGFIKQNFKKKFGNKVKNGLRHFIKEEIHVFYRTD